MNKRRRGLTVLEIILSAAIVAVAATIIAQVFFSSDKLTNRTMDSDEAAFLSVELLESMQYEDFADFFENAARGTLSGVVQAAGITLNFEDGVAEEEFSTESGLLVKVDAVFADERLSIAINTYRDGEAVCDMSKTLHYRRLNE